MPDRVNPCATAPEKTVAHRLFPKIALIRVTVVFWLLLAGCTPSSPSAAPEEEPVEVSLRVVDKAAFDQALQQYRGRVVLVDFWATWCPPCIELFPHAVDLHRRLADRGLAVVSVSLDDPGNKEAVLKFLVGKGARFNNFVSQYGSGTESFEVFDVGSLPCCKLYDREGKLRRSFSSVNSPIDPDEIDRAVEELLKR